MTPKQITKRPCAHGYWFGHCPWCTGSLLSAWTAAILREHPDAVTNKRGQPDVAPVGG